MKENILGSKTDFPYSLQGILWSKSIEKIDLYKDKNYIIHQILAYGDMEEIKWLLKTYNEDEIKDVFINCPRNVYTRPVFLFIKNFILGIEKKLNEKEYIKNIAGTS
jgi:hypothetical protein